MGGNSAVFRETFKMGISQDSEREGRECYEEKRPHGTNQGKGKMRVRRGVKV